MNRINTFIVLAVSVFLTALVLYLFIREQVQPEAETVKAPLKMEVYRLDRNPLPDADVYINQRFIGRTDKKGFFQIDMDLTVGESYTLRIEKDQGEFRIYTKGEGKPILSRVFVGDIPFSQLKRLIPTAFPERKWAEKARRATASTNSANTQVPKYPSTQRPAENARSVSERWTIMCSRTHTLTYPQTHRPTNEIAPGRSSPTNGSCLRPRPDTIMLSMRRLIDRRGSPPHRKDLL